MRLGETAPGSNACPGELLAWGSRLVAVREGFGPRLALLTSRGKGCGMPSAWHRVLLALGLVWYRLSLLRGKPSSKLLAAASALP